MLACVCRPVSGSLPKHPALVMPIDRTNIIVTREPTTGKNEVPGRPSPVELRAMALRQQQQIDSQHQLLAAKEQRLRFLKSQEAREAAAVAEGERLRRLRERVEAQESKLRRLRALRGQVDLQKTYNVTLSNDLDSIRALFSEKEKELSLAVAKVEALTRQLEELRRDRRGPLNLIPGNGNGQELTSPAARELEKLRRELMYRNQLSLQQDARLHLQREALQQRQAELRSVDQRILELQTRLQRKKASNLILQAQQQNSPAHTVEQTIQQIQSHFQITSTQHQLHQSQLQHQQNKKQILSTTSSHNQNSQTQYQTSNIPLSVRPSNSVYPSQRIINRSNVAAVEPYIHTPQKSTITQTPVALSNNTSGHLENKQAAATLNTNQQNQLIQDLTNLKLNYVHVKANVNVNHLSYAESDETKLARQKLSSVSNKTTITALASQHKQQHSPRDSSDSSTSIQLTKSKLPYKSTTVSKNISNLSSNSPSNPKSISNESNSEKITEPEIISLTKNSKQQLTVHSIPLNTANKSVATVLSTAATTISTSVDNNNSHERKHVVKPKVLHQISSGNMVVPPRKPISSVAPTSVTHTSAIPKIIAQSPKINKVAPSLVSSSVVTNSDTEKLSPRPALPPKPNKSTPIALSNSTCTTDSHFNLETVSLLPSSGIPLPPTVVSVINKTPISEPNDISLINCSNSNFPSTNPDNLPIKAKPLTIRKQPLSEQPRLKSQASGIKPIQFQSRRIEMPPAFLFPNIEKTELKDKSSSSKNAVSLQTSSNNNQQLQSRQHQPSLPSPESTSNTSTDETDHSVSSSTINEENKSPDDPIKRRLRLSSGDNSKIKLARRVSFDPLALLLDASLEGELELVKKTAMQVTDPSAANDEGITALHNAICAGHIEIVQFLVEFGCDVNAQDSDGWTPLHCAASCNNLAMVKFLVENGACLFAATLSDHETPAEKCEEDEEGFDGCSEYLYSIQEKLGILNNGEVYAVFSYDAQQTDELSFAVNDRLTILRKGDDAEREWWWTKTINGAEGYVPRNLLGLYPRTPLQNLNYSD